MDLDAAACQFLVYSIGVLEQPTPLVVVNQVILITGSAHCVEAAPTSACSQETEA